MITVGAPTFSSSETCVVRAVWRSRIRQESESVKRQVAPMATVRKKRNCLAVQSRFAIAGREARKSRVGKHLQHPKLSSQFVFRGSSRYNESSLNPVMLDGGQTA